MKKVIEKVLPFFRERTLAPPKTYFIELTNFCNLRCSMCNFHSPELSSQGRRAKGFMDVKLAKYLIDQIVEFGSAWLAFHGAGESLLHKGLTEILRYASRCNGITFGFLTNGMLLDERRSSEILDSGMSWIGFSLDGIDKGKFEKYRVGSNYDIILKNVMRFLDMNDKKAGRVVTTVNMTLQEEMKDDVDAFIDFWVDKVNQVSISPYRPVGSRINALVNTSVQRIPCYMLYEMMLIYWNGDVGLCCEDWFNAGNMGKTGEKAILDVWRGRQFCKVRTFHEKGRFDKTPLCKDCNSWHNAIVEEYTDERRGCRVRKTAWQYLYTNR